MRACKALLHAFHVFKSETETTKTLTEDLESSSPPRPRNFHEYLINLADSLPWFGEEPFMAAPEPTPPRPVHRSPTYVRRILLAFLAGRPVAVAAGRAGCSPRTLYGVINRVIYGPRPEKLHQLWLYLGLIVIVDYDEERPPPDDRPMGTLERVVYEDDALLFCLVCHRFIMPVESQRSTIPQMLEDGALFPPIVNYGDLGHVQGHLAVHFRLEEDSVARITDPSESFGVAMAEFFSVFGSIKNPKVRRLMHRDKRSKRRVLDEKAWEILRQHNRSDGQNLMPLIGMRSMLPDQARHHWRRMILNPGGRWRKKRRRRVQKSLT